MSDRIVYTLVTQGGGVDGRDSTDKGGKVTGAYFDRLQAERDGNKPWCDVVAIVIDDAKTKREALAKLSPVDKLILGLK